MSSLPDQRRTNTETPVVSHAAAASGPALDSTADPPAVPGTVDAGLRFLGAVAQATQQDLDYAGARRALHTAAAGASGDSPAEALTQRIQALGPTLHLRIDRLNLTAREAVALVRPTAPLGLLRMGSDGRLQWAVVSDHRGRRVKVHGSSWGDEPHWITLKTLSAMLELPRGDKCDWLALQPMLPCEAVQDEHGHGPAPLSRYLKLLAPERSDIAVIVVFAIVVGILALSSPIAVEALVNTVAFGQFIQPVVVLAVILFVFLAFAAAMRAVQAYIAEIIQRRIFVRVASDLAQRLPRVEAGFWRKQYGPELVNRFFEVVTVQKVTAQLLLDGLALLLQTLVGMTVIAFYHPVFLGFDAFLLLLIAGVIFVLGRGAVGTSIDESRKKYAIAAWLEELARHRLAFRSEGGMKFALEQADGCITGYLRARAVHFRVLMRQIISTLLLQVLASTVLLGLGGWLVIRGELTLGQLVAAELIVTVILGSLAKVGKYLEGYYDVMASVDKLGHLFDMPLEQHGGVELPCRTGGIALRLDELSFIPSRGGERPTAHASLRIQAGERVAVVGAASGLRSDLLEVLGGSRYAESGHVELDGFDLRRLQADSVHSQVSYVACPEVFAGTIAENIHVGRAAISEEDIRLALAATGLLEELLDLPEGLSTHLETEGRSLSQEQLARLMLARAIAGRPRLMLVDHAFDCLPDDRLHGVLRGVVQSMPACTWVVATGRRDVAMVFNRRIELLEDGSLREAVVHQSPASDPLSPRRRRRARR